MSPVRSVTYVSGPDLMRLARPEGFEPPTLCLGGRLLTSRKQFIFNHSIEKLFRENVPGCAQTWLSARRLATKVTTSSSTGTGATE